MKGAMTHAKVSPRFAILCLTLFAAGLTALFVGTEPEARVLAQGNASLKLPLKEGSVRFAVIGDSGRANSGQIQVGKQMVAFHQEFPFEFVIMAGDNI